MGRVRLRGSGGAALRHDKCAQQRGRAVAQDGEQYGEGNEPWWQNLSQREQVPEVTAAVEPIATEDSVLCFSNNARVFGTISPAKTPWAPSPNWRGNGGAQH